MTHYIDCKKHGPTLAYTSGGRLRCKKCNSEAVSDRRRVIKAKAIEYKGGACSMCGYNKFQGALEFHHTDPSQKDFAIAHKGHCTSWEKIKMELDKCILVCSNCHRELHGNVTQQVE